MSHTFSSSPADKFSKFENSNFPMAKNLHFAESLFSVVSHHSAFHLFSIIMKIFFYFFLKKELDFH